MTARRTGIASVAALAGLTLTVGVVHAVAPDWSRKVGLDVWNSSEAEAEARAADERRRELHDRADRVTRLMGASEHVAHALAAGRTTLADAVEALTHINDTRDGFQDTLRVYHRDATSDRERVARYAIGKVKAALAANPARRAEVLKKLGGEYAALVGKVWTPAE